MKEVHTHTFAGRKYYIDIMDTAVEGWCDMPDLNEKRGKAGKLRLHVQDGNTRKALSILIHECLHAEHFSESHVDKKDSKDRDAADRIAALAWRMGWRRK